MSKCPFKVARWRGVQPFIVVGFLTSMFSVMSWQISKWPNSAAIWKCVIPYLSLGILLSILLIMFTNAQLTWNGVPSFVCSILFYYWLNFCHPTLQRCLESILKISASWCLILNLPQYRLKSPFEFLLCYLWSGILIICLQTGCLVNSWLFMLLICTRKWN